MAKADKVRYNREMSSYIPPKGFGKRGRKRKDPNAPKRPPWVSGYTEWYHTVNLYQNVCVTLCMVAGLRSSYSAASTAQAWSSSSLVCP